MLQAKRVVGYFDFKVAYDRAKRVFLTRAIMFLEMMFACVGD
jgi:hypothetical protein